MTILHDHWIRRMPLEKGMIEPFVDAKMGDGHVTLEFSTPTPLSARIHANGSAAQFLFPQGSEPCEVSCRDKAGTHQGRRGVTPPRI